MRLGGFLYGVVLILMIHFVYPTTSSYIYHVCTNGTSFASNTPYESNLKRLLSVLSNSSSASKSNGFHNATSSSSSNDVVYGLFLCRGYNTQPKCAACVATAATELPARCPRDKEAVIWYDDCMLRYSNHYIFSTLEESPLRVIYNTQAATNTTLLTEVVMASMAEISASAAADTTSGKKYGAKEAALEPFKTVYSFVECTPDLSADDCKHCLKYVTANLMTGYLGSEVLGPSCISIFEDYPFFGNATVPPTAAVGGGGNSGNATVPPTVAVAGGGNSDSPSEKKTRHIPKMQIIVVVSASVLILLLLLYLWICIYKMKTKKSCEDIIDIVAVEFLHMEFNMIRAATQNFAIENKLGQGGFGQVYKGTLENGQDIAVKRLSGNSSQGIVEFKTEVVLVAKLQHRNLVKILGFCISGKEKILVYEFLPNSSLDKILFDPTKRMSLNWESRFKIIFGIAKGLLYLHEDSRLKIVHRDLKPSNILLDEAMNPKISDFGLAKLFSVDQTQDATSTIAGTYGYMAPEYKLRGHYSVKSDVYSFGVMVLELVSSQRNYMDRPHYGESLLHRAWRLWNESATLNLVDETLGDKYSREEVIKCIHIGLLCIQENAIKRPNMTTIVASLRGQAIPLPLPSPPGFFAATDPTSIVNISICETSDISELYPR